MTKNEVNSEINKEQNRRIEWLENHWSTFNDEMGHVKIDVALIKEDIKWVKKVVWWIIPTMIAGFGSLIGLLVSHITVA